MQVIINPELEVRLKQLAQKSKLSVPELLNNAFTLFEWAVEQTEKGNKLGSINESKGVYTEVRLDALQKISGPKPKPSFRVIDGGLDEK